MNSRLHDQNSSEKIAEAKLSRPWVRAIRTRLLGGSLGAVIALLPSIAHAEQHHHRPLHHTSREHVRLYHTDYRHEDHRSRDTHIVRVDYRSERTRHEYEYRRPREDHLVRINRYHERDRDHTPRLTFADYHTRHEYYHHQYQHVFTSVSYSSLQCVPYAREVSHIELSGDAFLWWAEAAGRYQRGHVPYVGSVLNFRSIGRMPLGHVAVVTAVLDSRRILVTQANWVRGTVTNDVVVEDVSPDNNWTNVRVEYGDSNDMGSVYPTYGFIYNRPAYAPAIYAANAGGRNEVAEAPMTRPISAEAPNRSLR